MMKSTNKARRISLALAAILMLGTVGCAKAPHHADTDVTTAEAHEKTEVQSPFKDNVPAIDADINELRDVMAQFEESGFPAAAYRINVSGFGVPVTLTMHGEYVAEIEAYGQSLRLYRGLDIYGNCGFELFCANGAVILQGGYYRIGYIYALTPEKCIEVHPGKEASYWLWTDDGGNLKYRLSNNSTPGITQAGPLEAVSAYDELLYALGDAKITGGELVFDEPYEVCTASDKYDLDAEFEANFQGKGKYANIEELFAANHAKKEAANDSVAYTRHGIAVALPELYLRDLTYITPVYTTPTTQLPENVIAEFYQFSVMESGGGWLFSVVRHSEDELLSKETNHAGFTYFAHDDIYWYGVMCPTDVQLDLNSESLREEYRMLYAMKDEVIQTILCANPGLIPCGNEEAYSRYAELHTEPDPPSESSRLAVADTSENADIKSLFLDHLSYLASLSEEEVEASDEEFKAYYLNAYKENKIPELDEFYYPGQIFDGFILYRIVVDEWNFMYYYAPAHKLNGDVPYTFDFADGILLSFVRQHWIDSEDPLGAEEQKYIERGYEYIRDDNLLYKYGENTIHGIIDNTRFSLHMPEEYSDYAKLSLLATQIIDTTETVKIPYFDVLEHPIHPQQSTIHQSILEDKATVYSSDFQSSVLLSSFLKTPEMHIIKYAVIDLDGDNTPETVLSIAYGTNEYYGFVILHSEDETTYAHSLTYRAFTDLKADGTFGFSSGVSNHGIGRIDFFGDTYTIHKVAYCESEDNQNVSYFVENKSVSKETFNAYEAAHSQKTNVVWSDYTFDA